MLDQKILMLQEVQKKKHLSLYCIGSSDYHLSEYVPSYFRTVAYFSGFTGSVSTLLVGEEKAWIFVDGRYHIQAEKQCLPRGIEVVKLGTEGALDPLSFIKEYYPGKRIGLDGKRMSIRFVQKLLAQGNRVVSCDLYSDLIEDRPPLCDDVLWQLEEKYCGLSRKEKLVKIAYAYQGKCHVLNNLDAIAWLLNLRGNDIPFTPVFLSYLVFYRNDFYLFLDLKRLNEEELNGLYEDGVIIRPYDEYYDFLSKIKKEKVFLDENKVNYETLAILEKGRNTICPLPSLVDKLKAVKNPVEIANVKQASVYDGVAMVRFLNWLDKSDKRELNEYSVCEKLNAFRREYKAFDLSFNPIVAYNANAAMMHYSATENDHATLDNSGILLIDSGGQYKEGTTDITRTIALGETDDVVKKHFTLVLKSMFELSSLVFLSGLSGAQVDIAARRSIWEEGLDYRCGTGHGIGQVLSVHENPPNIRYTPLGTIGSEEPLKAGHMVSDEPGIYLEGKYGIRCENILMVEKGIRNEYGQFLHFDTITLCPFDLRLIDREVLDEKTRKLLNDYHRTVYEKLSPYLNEEDRAYLEKATEAIV